MNSFIADEQEHASPAEPLLGGAASAIDVTGPETPSYVTIASGDGVGSSGGGFAALLDPRYRRIMALAAGLPLLQQLSGINTVIFYSSQVCGGASPLYCVFAMVQRGNHLPLRANAHATHTCPPLPCCPTSCPALPQSSYGTWFGAQLLAPPSLTPTALQVFKQAGLSSPVLASVALGCGNLGMTLVAAVLMDRAGRRALLTASFAGMGACLALTSAFMWLPGEDCVGAGWVGGWRTLTWGAAASLMWLPGKGVMACRAWT